MWNKNIFCNFFKPRKNHHYLTPFLRIFFLDFSFPGNWWKKQWLWKPKRQFVAQLIFYFSIERMEMCIRQNTIFIEIWKKKLWKGFLWEKFPGFLKDWKHLVFVFRVFYGKRVYGVDKNEMQLETFFFERFLIHKLRE